MQDRGASDLPLGTQSALLFGASIQATRPTLQQITPSTAVPAAFAPPPIQLIQPPPTRDHRQSAERARAP
eukprot:361645-Alexandrium_andersonii.AAC.1